MERVAHPHELSWSRNRPEDIGTSLRADGDSVPNDGLRRCVTAQEGALRGTHVWKANGTSISAHREGRRRQYVSTSGGRGNRDKINSCCRLLCCHYCHRHRRHQSGSGLRAVLVGDWA